MARDDALFVENGVPVKFCFHRSVKQGRNRITHDVERHGGQVVDDERMTNVLLVDEQEDLALIQRQYYSSTLLYRHSIYVEQRGFVQTCIRSGRYHHEPPKKQGMPGRAPGSRKRARVSFTPKDRDDLAFYLATCCPTKDGRMGNLVYQKLVQLGEIDDPCWEWARRHTFHSWREHYARNQELMDERIEYHIQRLRNVGHHRGHDSRSHNQQNPSEGEEEEEEEEDEREGEGEDEEEQWQGINLVTSAAQRHPGQSHDYLARREGDRVPFEEAEEDVLEVTPPLQRAQPLRTQPDACRRSTIIEVEDESDVQEPAPSQPQQVNRRRAHSNTYGRPEFREPRAKKACVVEETSHEKLATDIKAGRAEGDSEDTGESFDGSDLFGDGAYEASRHVDLDNDRDFRVPLSPRASPVPEQEMPPPSSFVTLVSSSPISSKESSPAPVQTASSLKAQLQTMIQEYTAEVRERMRDTPVQPEPSTPVPNERRAPYQDACPRSVKPQSSRQREQEDSENDAPQEAVLIEELVKKEPSETAVEVLLDASMRIESNEDEKEDIDVDDESIIAELPRYQDVEMGNMPSDSDDAETHESLAQGGSAGGDEADEEFADEEEPDGRKDKGEDEDDVESVEPISNGRLAVTRVPSPPQPRSTRSQTAKQAEPQKQPSPRRTRSGNHAPAVPSRRAPPRTKVRAAADRVQAEERGAPPQGSRSTRSTKTRGK